MDNILYMDKENKGRKREKKKENFVYFNIPERFLNTELTKSEVMAYITHCRSAGKWQNGNSIAAHNAVTKYFGKGISPKVYETAMRGLEEKGLITPIRLANRMGAYMSKYSIQINKNEDEKYIQMPIDLIDNKVMQNFTLKEFKDIVTLYKYLNIENCWGCIDIDYISLTPMVSDFEASEYTIFGDGFNIAIYKKKAYKLQEPNIDDLDDFNINIDEELKEIDIIEFINKGFFTLIPLIYEVDEDDKLIKRLLGEVMHGLVRFSNSNSKDFYIWHLKENNEIFWALKPVYNVKTLEYEAFKRIEAEYKDQQIKLYSDTDITTFQSKKISLLQDEDFGYYISTLHNLDFLDEILLNIDELKSFKDIEELQNERNLIANEHNAELQRIEQENKAAAVRRRHTTSALLKDLRSRYDEIVAEIEERESIETGLLELVPNWAFKAYDRDVLKNY